MPPADPSPAELRNMFGANLRQLSAVYPSISDLSRQLGINRTQFNRYLSGESFPRPDVLSRICTFFKVDARVLLEPVDQIGNNTQDPIANPFLYDYVGKGADNISEETFPSGFYRFSRRSFLKQDVFIASLVHVFRNGPNTFMRGYESRAAMRTQGLPETGDAREFRGLVIQQEDGIAIIVSRKNAMTCSYNYLNRVASFENNYWVGYATRTIPDSGEGLRATRMVYEYLGPTARHAFEAGRGTGFYTTQELMPFHRRLLRVEEPFY